MISQSSTSIDDELHLIIGKTVRWWSMIEFTVDSSVRDFLNRPDTENLNTSLKIPLPKRIELLCRLYEQVVTDPDLRQDFTNLIDRVKRRQHMRDLLVHGFMAIDASRPTTHVYLSRIHWENPTRRDPVYKSRDQLHRYERGIGTIAQVLFMVTAGCHHPFWQPYFEKRLLQTLPQ